MRVSICIIFCLFIFHVVFAQEVAWVQKIDGDRCESVTGICTLPKGDVIVSGIYEDKGGVSIASKGGKPMQFAPESDTFRQSHSTLFVARFAPSGTLRWAINVFAENGIHAWDTHTDAQGNIVLCGNFRGTAIFNARNGRAKVLHGVRLAGASAQTQSLPLNIFVVKYDPQGNILWAKAGLSQDNSVAFQVKSDAENNVYVRAYCAANAIGFDNLLLLPSAQAYMNSFSILLLKYSPKGELLWLVCASEFAAKDMQVSAAGEVSLLGTLSQRCVLRTASGAIERIAPPAANGQSTCTSLVMSAEGEWLRATPVWTQMPNAQLLRSACDTHGNTWALMLVSQAWTTPAQPDEVYLSKFDKQDKMLWQAKLGGSGKQKVLDLVVDADGNAFVSGCYKTQLRISGAAAQDSMLLQSETNRSLYIASFSAVGGLRWARNCGNLYWDGYQEELNLVIDAQNRIFFGGQLNMTSAIGGHEIALRGELGNAPPQNGRQWYRYSDGFWGCIEAATPIATPVDTLSDTDTAAVSVAVPVLEMPVFRDVSLFPNPVSAGVQAVNLRMSLAQGTTVSWQLLDITGKILQQQSPQPLDIGEHTVQLSVAGYAAGVYILNLLIGETPISQRVVVL